MFYSCIMLVLNLFYETSVSRYITWDPVLACIGTHACTHTHACMHARTHARTHTIILYIIHKTEKGQTEKSTW